MRGQRRRWMACGRHEGKLEEWLSRKLGVLIESNETTLNPANYPEGRRNSVLILTTTLPSSADTVLCATTIYGVVMCKLISVQY